MKIASPRGEVPSLSRRRGVTSMQAPLSRLKATAAPGRPLLPYGQFTLFPQGEPSLVLRAIHLVPTRGASHMTCIGRPSLSLGRGAELVEAERGETLCANPSQSPYSDSSPQGEPSRVLWVIHLVPLRGALANSPCLLSKGRWLRA